MSISTFPLLWFCYFVHFCISYFVHFSIGYFVHFSISYFVHFSISYFVHFSIGYFVHFTLYFVHNSNYKNSIFPDFISDFSQKIAKIENKIE